MKVRRVVSPNSNASPSPSSAAAPPSLRIRQALAQWQPSSSARSQRREVPLICLRLSPFEAAVSSTRLLSARTRRSGLRGASEQPTTSLSVRARPAVPAAIARDVQTRSYSPIVHRRLVYVPLHFLSKITPVASYQGHGMISLFQNWGPRLFGNQDGAAQVRGRARRPKRFTRLMVEASLIIPAETK